MSVRPMICLAIALAFALALAACDRRPSAPAVATAPAAVALELELKPITPLLPNRPTHVTVDMLGNIYWVQEGDRADDTMFVIGEGDIPRATQLSVANIAAAMDASGARGNIHDIAAGPGGEIYFYFSGNAGRQSLACVGLFNPKTAQVRVLADADALATATGMGRSLPLARGTVISDSRNIWIWLRHTDDWAIFRVDPRGLPTSGPTRLARPFETVTLAGKPLALTRDEYQMSAAPGGMLFLLDPVAGQLLKITPSGAATVARSLVGLPVDLSTPAVDRTGRMLLFAANDDLIKPQPGADAAAGSASPIQQTKIDATFPAMLLFDDAEKRVAHIGRDDMQAYPGFPVFGMRLRQLVPRPSEEAWISYDAGSGELLRVKIREKTFQ
jgi:hypothetical protein